MAHPTSDLHFDANICLYSYHSVEWVRFHNRILCIGDGIEFVRQKKSNVIDRLTATALLELREIKLPCLRSDLQRNRMEGLTNTIHLDFKI